MTGYLAVGFDLDGTLFDHNGSAVTGLNRYIQSLGHTPSDELSKLWFAAEAEYFEQWRAGHISFTKQRRLRLRALFTSLGIDCPDSDPALDRAFQAYLCEYQAAWRPYPDAVDVLANLRERGIGIGVLTNGNHEQQLAKLDRTGLLPYIDTVCTSEQLGHAKPDPRAFQALARALDLSPAELIFVGDNPDHDVAAARAAGIRAGHIDRHTNPPGRLQDALDAAR